MADGKHNPGTWAAPLAQPVDGSTMPPRSITSSPGRKQEKVGQILGFSVGEDSIPLDEKRKHLSLI